MSNGTVTLVQTGNVEELNNEKGMTIAAALDRAGWTLGDDNEVRVNNKPVKLLDTILKDGDQVMIIGEVAGG